MTTLAKVQLAAIEAVVEDIQNEHIKKQITKNLTFGLGIGNELSKLTTGVNSTIELEDEVLIDSVIQGFKMSIPFIKQQSSPEQLRDNLISFADIVTPEQINQLVQRSIDMNNCLLSGIEQLTQEKVLSKIRKLYIVQ